MDVMNFALFRHEYVLPLLQNPLFGFCSPRGGDSGISAISVIRGPLFVEFGLQNLGCDYGLAEVEIFVKRRLRLCLAFIGRGGCLCRVFGALSGLFRGAGRHRRGRMRNLDGGRRARLDLSSDLCRQGFIARILLLLRVGARRRLSFLPLRNGHGGCRPCFGGRILGRCRAFFRGFLRFGYAAVDHGGQGDRNPEYGAEIFHIVVSS